MSRIVFFVLLIKTMLWSSGLNAQSYQTLSIDGFNQDVIANGVGATSTSTTSDVDGIGFSFKSIDWMLTSGSTPQTIGFPIDGIISSEATVGLKYQLKDYSVSNVIQLNSSSPYNLSNVSGQVKTKKLFILATAGNGNSRLTCKVTFEDNTTEVFSNISINDWYSGILPAVAYRGFGRINRMNDVVENPINNPRLYEASLTISTVSQNKIIKYIEFLRESSSIGVVNIFAVSAENFNPSPNNNILYVDQTVDKTTPTYIGDGSSWANAIPELADALLWAKKQETQWTTTAPLQIWVAGGTYKPKYSPEDGAKFGTDQDRDNTFLLVDNVKLYGGFAGTEVTLANRDLSITNNASILSGDLGILNDDSDNAGNVVFAVGTANKLLKAELNGFIITDGNANTISYSTTINTININKNSGGGMFNIYASIVLTNVSILNNKAKNVGGGIASIFHATTLTNVIISGNHAVYGGGIFNQWSSSILRNVIITENTISSSTVNSIGAGMHNIDSSPILINVNISKNTAFSSPSFPSYGGGMFNTNSSPVLTNVTISGNTAAEGGGLHNIDSSNLKIYNSIIWGNTKEDGITVDNVQNDSSTPTFNYSLIEGSSWSSAWGTNNNSIVSEVSPFTNAVTVDYSLKLGSVAINAGLNTYYTDADKGNGNLSVDKDLAGNPRLVGTTIDIGAYESEYLTPNCFVPMNVTIKDITANSTAISWTEPTQAPANGYEYEIRISGNPGDATGLVQQGTTVAGITTVSIIGLLPVTNYEVYVRSKCTSAIDSDWTTLKKFTTNCETPNLISFTEGEVCNGGEVTLSATYDNGTVRWFDSLTSNTTLGIGENFITPSLSSTKSYWVEAISSESLESNGGKIDLDSSANDVNTFKNWGIAFDLNRDVLIKSTDVYFVGSGSIDIAIIDNNGIELFSTGDVPVSSANVNTPVTIPLNFQLVAGTGYRMALKTFSGVKLYRDSFVSFPYEESSEILTVTSGFYDGYTKDFYYYFYNIAYEKVCVSPRTEVVAKIIDTIAPIANDQTFCIAEVKTVSELVAIGFLIKWYNSVTATVPLNATDVLVSGTYYATQTLDGCESVGRTPVIVTIENPLAPTVTSPIQYIYGDTSVALTAIADSTNSLLWYNTENGGTGSTTAPIPTTNAVGNQEYWVSQITANGCESEREKITVNISPAELTVTATPGQSKVYGDADPVFDYTVSGYANGDTATVLTGALSRVAGEDVGAYAINQNTLSAGANYDIVFIGADFEITKAILTVTVDANQSKIYGEADPVFDYTVSGYTNGDTATVLTGVLSRIAGEEVGAYAINKGTLSAGVNYDITFVGADFEIAKATLTVTVDANQSKVYGDADPVFGYTVSGYENGDTMTVLTGALSRVAGEAVGVYAINKGTLSAGANYDITFIGANFEITKATLTVTTNANQTKVYGDVDPVFDYTVSGYANGDTATILSGLLSRDAGEVVGGYAINKGTLSAGANYDITFVAADFEIIKAILTVTTNANQSKVYGDADPVFDYTVSGYKNGDTAIILTGLLSRDAGENVGIYTINQGSLTVNDNYDLVFVGANFEIIKAILTVTVDANQSKVYGDADPVFGYTVAGYENGDTATVLTGALSRIAGEEVGAYAINQGSLSAGDNYDITFFGADFEITKATLTVTVDANQSKVYGDIDPVFDYTVSGYANGDTATVLTGVLSRVAGEAVGVYAINQNTLNAGANYDITFIGADFEITKATLTVTTNANQSKVYGDADSVFGYTVSGYENGDTATLLTGVLSRVAGEDVGVYAINKGSLSAGANYDITFIGADFEIAKATLTVTTNANQSKVYGDADPIFGYAVSGYTNGDTMTVLTGALSRVVGEDVGAYAINQNTLSAGDNYDITFFGADFEIAKATLTVTTNANQSKVYGDADPIFGYAVSGYTNGDTASVLSGVLSRDAGEIVGIYAINQNTLNAGTNYDITFIGADFEITKAILTVTTNANQSKLYGETDPVFDYTVSGYENGDTATVLTGALSRFAGEAVGVYAINQGGLSAGANYDITFVGANFEITKAILTVTVDANQSKVYGDADPVFDYTVSGYENGDTATVLTGALSRVAGEDVGGYAINLGSLSAGANYDITFIGADFEITKAILTVTTNANQSKVYGDIDPVFDYTVSGYENGDTATVLSGVLSRDAGEVVGIYAINQNTLNAGTNYDITFIGADFEITKATLTVTVNANQSKVYGDTDSVFGYTVSGYANGDTATILSGLLSRDAGENVGIYTINQGSLSAGANYDIVFVGADFEITKAILTVTTNANQSKIYGDADPVFGYTVSGYENGDTATVLSGVLSRDAGENVGIYTINQGSLSAGDNYDIVFVGADFEITKATLTITVDANQSKVYGDADPVFDYTVSGYKNGDTDTILSGTLGRVAGEAVGVYAINKGTLSAGANYDITFIGADFEITNAILTVTVDANQSKVYGETDPVFDYTVSGYTNGDTATILSGVLSRVAGEDVGTYAINQNTLSASANYDITFIGADFEITKATIQGVTLDDATFGYDGTVKSLVINGALPTGTSVTYQNNSHINLGVYSVTATISGGNNYFDIVLSADLTIEKGTITGVYLPNGTFTYDGTVKSLVINGVLPTGTSVTYVNNDHINAGVYAVTAVIDGGANYNDLTLNSNLTIKKALITGIIFNDAVFTYDGTPKSITIQGTLPSEASVSYQNNDQIDAGIYIVTANINGGGNYENFTLTARLTTEKAPQTLDFNIASPVVLEDVQDYQLDGSASSGLEVSYTYSYNSVTPAAEVSESGWLEFKHPGEIEITAHQEGNHNYHAATAVTKTLVVESRDATIHELWIDKEHFEIPSGEIIYTMDCDSLQNEVSIRIQTQLGATVDPSHEFVISVPNPGIYREIVKVTSQNGKVIKEYVIRIEKPFLFSYIAEQKYDNVLLINNNPKTNGGYTFVKFEWYKNGELIGSEQVYSAGNRSTDLLDKTAQYHAVLTTDSGDVLYVCPTEITLKHQYNIKLYPSPAKAGNSVTVKITYPLDQLRGERLDIFDMNGKRITSTTITTEDTEFVLPSSLQTGTYIATFKLNGQHKVIHFSVE